MNTGKTQEDKKAKAMYSIGDKWATLAELLGGPENITYLEFQMAMLARDRERRAMESQEIKLSQMLLHQEQ